VTRRLGFIIGGLPLCDLGEPVRQGDELGRGLVRRSPSDRELLFMVGLPGRRVLLVGLPGRPFAGKLGGQLVHPRLGRSQLGFQCLDVSLQADTVDTTSTRTGRCGYAQDLRTCFDETPSGGAAAGAE
jgi:hypothetical protein